MIGGGIGGSASAYFLHKFVKGGCEVTIFEQNDYIGGRLKHLEIDGATVNLGGDAWSNVILSFSQLLLVLTLSKGE